MYWLYHTTITWCNNIPPRYKFTELVHTEYQFTDVHCILTTSLTTLLMLIAIFYVVASVGHNQLRRHNTVAYGFNN